VEAPAPPRATPVVYSICAAAGVTCRLGQLRSAPGSRSGISLCPARRCRRRPATTGRNPTRRKSASPGGARGWRTTLLLRLGEWLAFCYY
jgi:hypothetical protein